MDKQQKLAFIMSSLPILNAKYGFKNFEDIESATISTLEKNMTEESVDELFDILKRLL